MANFYDETVARMLHLIDYGTKNESKIEDEMNSDYLLFKVLQTNAYLDKLF